MNQHFNLSLSITLQEAISEHPFSLRMLPREDACQSMGKLDFSIAHCSAPVQTVDGFGNQIIYGHLDEPDSCFSLLLQGEVSLLKPYGEERDEVHFSSLYVVPTELVAWSDRFLDFMGENEIFTIEDPAEYVYACNKFVHSYLKHKAEISLESMGIDSILENREGYSQDATHLLLAMLRLKRIPARFISGYNFEENELLYWAEVMLEGKWIGLDPVHNRKIAKESYIRVAHGRDFHDCQFYRGAMGGMMMGTPSSLQMQLQLQQA